MYSCYCRLLRRWLLLLRLNRFEMSSIIIIFIIIISSITVLIIAAVAVVVVVVVVVVIIPIIRIYIYRCLLRIPSISRCSFFFSFTSSSLSLSLSLTHTHSHLLANMLNAICLFFRLVACLLACAVLAN